MPDTKLETMEPDPAATSLPNDETVNKTATELLESAEKNVAQPVVETESKPEEEAPEDAPVKAEIAKDTKVEVEGHKTNGHGDNEAKAQSPQKRRREDDDRRGSGRGGNKKFKRGNFFDPTVQDITDDPVAIRKQVEFYFSDANLARDKFLFDKVEGSNNSPVDIKVLHSFKRMRRFQPYEAVLKALRESTLLDVTDDEKIKRKTALPTDFENKTLEEITKVVEDEAMSRTVYVKGFGREEPSTQFDIEAWFSNFGTTNQVRLRRSDDKHFKGSVFAEFDSETTAKKFLELDPKPKYNEHELKIMSKKEYCDEKVQAIQEGLIQPDGRGGYKRTDRGRGRGSKDDARDWRERREEDRKNGFRDRRGGNRNSRGRGRGDHDRRDRGRNDDRGEDTSKDKSEVTEAKKEEKAEA